MRFPHQLRPPCFPVYGSGLAAHTEKHKACFYCQVRANLLIFLVRTTHNDGRVTVSFSLIVRLVLMCLQASPATHKVYPVYM